MKFLFKLYFTLKYLLSSHISVNRFVKRFALSIEKIKAKHYTSQYTRKHKNTRHIKAFLYVGRCLFRSARRSTKDVKLYHYIISYSIVDTVTVKSKISEIDLLRLKL